jgi:hypothetical protein
MKEVIGDNPADRKQFIHDMVRRDVASSKELTYDEGHGLIDAFEKAKRTENPIVEVIDIYRRTTGDAPPPAARSLKESVVGTPAGPGDDEPPWAGIDPPSDNEWPAPAVPGARS